MVLETTEFSYDFITRLRFI